MKQEGEFQRDTTAAKFRDDFFLHSVAAQNPRLYHELFDDPDIPEEWEIPRTPEDLQSMMAELAAVGVNLNVRLDEVRPVAPASDHQFDIRPAMHPWNA